MILAPLLSAIVDGAPMWLLLCLAGGVGFVAGAGLVGVVVAGWPRRRRGGA